LYEGFPTRYLLPYKIIYARSQMDLGFLLYYHMDIEEIIRTASRHIKRCHLPARALTSRLPYIPPSVKRRAYFGDPRHFPAFYHLGQAIKPNTVLDLTLGWGLSTACFLFGHKPEYVGVFQRNGDHDYSNRMAVHNIRRAYRRKLGVYAGGFNDVGLNSLIVSSKWDAVIINEDIPYDDYLAYIRLAWGNLSDNGVIIMNYVNYDNSAGRAYDDFCKTNHKPKLYVKSKYGIGLMFK